MRPGALALPRVALRASVLVALTTIASCGQIVRYTDALADQATGRSLFVTTPAHVGGVAGFALGLPVDLIALPITFPVYRIQRSENKAQADPVSTMLFPSFALWRAGALLATPFDMLEYAAVRAWRSPRQLDASSQEAFEYELDEETLPSYPVESQYPPPVDPQR